MDDELPPWENFLRPSGEDGRRGLTTSIQKSMFNVRVSTILPNPPIGQHHSMLCIGEDGRTYHCKEDVGHMRIRATEWIATRLADHIGISVADCAIIEGFQGESYFGSREPISLGAEHEFEHFLNVVSRDETGRRHSWIGQYFARVWAFDLFVDNPDRLLRNFILDRDGSVARLRAIDFASARFLKVPDTNFPVATDNTSIVGKAVRNRYGAHCDAAFELLERIRAVPPGVIEGFIREMPDDWLPADQMGGFVEVWSNGFNRTRADQVKALIEHAWQT
jgi:hypothetical protein